MSDLNLSWARDFRVQIYGNLVYTLKKIVGTNNDISVQVIKISHYKKIDYKTMYINLNCSRLHAWWATQSRLTTLLSSLIACW